ncbi:hypothetical protein DLAC_02891 [Tieghemostelium lacteum]|uniref:Uncharacterized protein n=1 Tax=Tieghemostelium lacteum TaxID=361077 RepID=A0A152A445_TIELA|nr:hypothetical protein DLAC_02891 [Tieghemostelium lacteum]|eukprot:KYR00837.1 hypothetical protein DLAC_02891 [Tieghemostelium lacteum]
MNIKFSTQKFPLNPSVKDGSGTIWGMIVQPFSNDSHVMETSKNIERCKSCFAYISKLCKFTNKGWMCNICTTTNLYQFTSSTSSDDDSNYNSKYTSKYSDPIQRKTLPEIANTLLDLSVEDDSDYKERYQELPLYLQNLLDNPIYIAVVDLYRGKGNSMDIIESGLITLVKTLPDNALFGMIIIGGEGVGLVNFNSSTPLIKSHTFYSLKMSTFQDTLTLKSFLVNKSKFENNILSTIKVLSKMTLNRPLNPLGSIIQSLVEYLSIDETLKLNVKVGLFLSGSPNAGTASVEKDSLELDALYKKFNSKKFFDPHNQFYEGMAEESIRSGIHYDMFLMGKCYFALETIRYLTTHTGGHIYRYSTDSVGDVDRSKILIRTDIYKLICNGWGFHGMLRVRTSKNYQIDNCFGNVSASKNFDNLFHIESSSPFTSVGFDFKFTNPSAFEDREVIPTMQIVFSYNYMAPIEGEAQLMYNENDEITLPSRESNSSNGGSRIRKIEKRLRISNLSFQVAASPVDLFKSVEIETLFSLLTLKLIRESIEKGIPEARVLLEDWLINITTKYNENVVILNNVVAQADTSFIQLPNLKLLPRLVFALTKSMLLKELWVEIEDVTLESASDNWVYFQCLFSSLEPRLLQRAVYPLLISYSSLNTINFKYLSLSAHTVETTPSQLYLLDSYDQLVVYYKETSTDTFPPPSNSLITQTINISKQDRHTTPVVQYLKGPLYETFKQHLLEEESGSGSSYKEFLALINKNVSKSF